VPSAATLKVGLPSLSKYLPSSDLTALGSPGPSAQATPPIATDISAAATTRILRKSLSSVPEAEGDRRMDFSMRRTRLFGSLRQSEHRERSTERGVVAERSVATDGPEAFVRLGQAGCEADTGPATDAGQDGNELPAAVFIGRDVADDAG